MGKSFKKLKTNRKITHKKLSDILTLLRKKKPSFWSMEHEVYGAYPKISNVSRKSFQVEPLIARPTQPWT